MRGERDGALRVALVTPGFSASDEDWCIPAVAHLVKALSALAEVEVFALRYPHRTAPYRAFGAAVRPFGGAQRRGAARVALLVRASAAIAGAVRRRRFDIVHGLWADEAGWLAVRAAAGAACPSVVSVMGGELVALPELGYGTQRSAAGRWLVRRSLRRASAVTVGSRSLRALVGPQVARERLRELPLGVDTAMFAPQGTVEPLAGSPALLQVGALTPIKDQRTLLAAFARVAAAVPGARLHIAGEGPLRGELERRADDLGVAARVHFLGEVRHERLPALYRGARMVVVSSRFESQGMAAVEAAACGRIAVGTAVGVLPELFPDLPGARPGNASELAESVLTVLGDPERAHAAAEQALRLVRGRFALGVTVTSLIGLYRETSPMERHRGSVAIRRPGRAAGAEG